MINNFKIFNNKLYIDSSVLDFNKPSGIYSATIGLIDLSTGKIVKTANHSVSVNPEVCLFPTTTTTSTTTTCNPDLSSVQVIYPHVYNRFHSAFQSARMEIVGESISIFPGIYGSVNIFPVIVNNNNIQFDTIIKTGALINTNNDININNQQIISIDNPALFYGTFNLRNLPAILGGIDIPITQSELEALCSDDSAIGGINIYLGYCGNMVKVYEGRGLLTNICPTTTVEPTTTTTTTTVEPTTTTTTTTVEPTTTTTTTTVEPTTTTTTTSEPECPGTCLWEYNFPSEFNSGYWTVVMNLCEQEGCDCGDGPDYFPPAPEPGNEGALSVEWPCSATTT